MSDLRERFPALERLVPRGRKRRVPIILQHERAECGAACLTMVMNYHGLELRLDEVRHELGVGRGGLDAAAIVAGAHRYGMQARGLRVDLDDLDYLPCGTILHWEFNHFVVFTRATRTHVEYIDPASGARKVTLERFSRSFTGVAVTVEPGDGFERRTLNNDHFAVYLRYLFGQRELLSRVVVTSIVLRLLALALPILTAIIVDHMVPRGDHDLLLVVAAGLVGVVLFQALSTLTRAHLILQLRTNLDVRLTLGFLDHLVSLPYSFFQRRSAGDLLMRVASNANIREILTSNTLSALLDGALVLIYLALISWLSPALGGLTFVLGVAQVLVFIAARRRITDLMRDNLETQAQAQNYLVQILGGIETLKLGGTEGRAVERWSNLFVDQLNVSLDTGRLQATIDMVMASFSSGAPFLVLCVGASFVMSGELSLGQMLALNALAAGFLQPLASLVFSAMQMQRVGGYIERLHDVLSTTPEQDRQQVVPPPRLSGRVALRDLWFRYDARTPDVVCDINLEIEPGECVAIVGRSGSGKSTLASMLLGLHRPSQGAVLYDGHNLEEFDLRGVRHQVAFVPQHPYIFAQSVKENIAMGHPRASFEAVVRAAERAAIHDDIMAMGMAYETIVSEGGSSLSGGQRQRIALARALVREPALLILDEATSALDNRTEREVMDALSGLACARVIIAHRLSTISFADRIVVMDAGRVADVGTHAELLERCEVYRGLVFAGQASADHQTTQEPKHDST